jgi:hypothetical protein
MELLGEFLERGFLTFPVEETLLRWTAAARPAAEAVASDPAQAHWLRCGGTWFVGVDALPNDAQGRVGGGPALAGAAMDFIRDELGLALPLHRAQVSICYPGYPRPSAGESEAAYNFRLRRDAAHVDGLLAEGPEKRRYLREPHAYVLGLALTEQSAGAAPLTVWEGSHRLMGETFTGLFSNFASHDWREADVTAPYQEARRAAFAQCRRIELPSMPGESVLLHRHLLHGVAPWAAGAAASDAGRMIAYFRPQFSRLADWLSAP